MTESNVIQLDDFRPIEKILKDRLEAKHIIICTVRLDGMMSTYIEEDISDIDLVYLIQTLKDRRDEEWKC